MENKLNNPNAFPADTIDETYSGMSLRDYFAAKASMVIPVIKDRNFSQPTDKDYDEWAEKCYKRADALLKQREL